MKNKTDFYNIPYAHYPHTDGRYSPVEKKEFDHHWRLERPSLEKELYKNGLQKITKNYTQNWKKYFGSAFYIEFQSHLPTSIRKYIQQLFCFNQSECYFYISADLTTTLFGKIYTLVGDEYKYGEYSFAVHSFHFESPETCWINFSKGEMYKYRNGSKLSSYWV